MGVVVSLFDWQASKALATRFPRAVRALQREHECFRWKFEWIAALGQTLPVAEVLPTPATCRRAVGKQCRETPWALRTHFLYSALSPSTTPGLGSRCLTSSP